MIRQKVTSSALHSVGYDRETLILEIEFRNGHIYRYLGVPDSCWAGLMSASSKGLYFDAEIRNRFYCEKATG